MDSIRADKCVSAMVMVDKHVTSRKLDTAEHMPLRWHRTYAMDMALQYVKGV